MTANDIREFHEKLRHSWDEDMVVIRQACETCCLLKEIHRLYEVFEDVVKLAVKLAEERDSAIDLILEHVPIPHKSLDDLVRNLLQVNVTQAEVIKRMKEKPTMLMCGSCREMSNDPAGHICKPRDIR